MHTVLLSIFAFQGRTSLFFVLVHQRFSKQCDPVLLIIKTPREVVTCGGERPGVRGYGPGVPRYGPEVRG